MLTSLTGNELRKDLRKWIAPPDPSVNLKAASSAHREGTTAWCTKGKILADWKASGSLLWIHGKRTYFITACAILTLTTPGLIAGSGKSILRCVTPCRDPNQTYMIDKLRDYPEYQIHMQCWVCLLGIFLL